VAHRPSTVALADRVALLEAGRVTAVGTHSELLKTSAHYRHVISSLEAEEAARTGAIPVITEEMLATEAAAIEDEEVQA
ncbi:MAG TPA: ABC transporter ATP-binding protein, partial [Microbacterium sp.]|nr:ABC transporter ATP-binding protein [Microbacterium sp.]